MLKHKQTHTHTFTHTQYRNTITAKKMHNRYLFFCINRNLAYYLVKVAINNILLVLGLAKHRFFGVDSDSYEESAETKAD